MVSIQGIQFYPFADLTCGDIESVSQTASPLQCSSDDICQLNLLNKLRCVYVHSLTYESNVGYMCDQRW